MRRLLAEVGAGGGFVIAPTHSLGNDIPPENLLVLVEELRSISREADRDSRGE